MTFSQTVTPNSGSRWHRWDPHLHLPGTILNDSFQGDDAWERNIAAIEALSPTVRAIGVTDYYLLDTYKRFVESKANGAVPQCELIFPNIEIRLNLGVVKGNWANAHLLICPDDPNHLSETQRFLDGLTFEAQQDTFRCNAADLEKLGRLIAPEATDSRSALKIGCTQFKVDFNQLRKNYSQNAWAKANILFGSVSGNDGAGGLRDASDKSIRREIETFAHCIFSGNPNDRRFWLGYGPRFDADEIIGYFGSLKPCLHGSDAHEAAKTGNPDLNRYCWIKGAVTFDALMQACIEPAGRAYVGEEPPDSGTPSQAIAAITIAGAPWLQTPVLQLNPGFVAIIGARGSGKTALAEMIAAGCNAIPDRENRSSFLYRAHNYLRDVKIKLGWGSGSESPEKSVLAVDDDVEQPVRARYLSQQFVNDLCASEGMTDALVSEIERVVFQSHDVNAREGAVDFAELLTMRAARPRQARDREEHALATLSEQIGLEYENDLLLPSLKNQLAAKETLVQRYTTDRSKLVVKGGEEAAASLDAVSRAAEKVRGNVRASKAQEQSLLLLQDEATDTRRNRSPRELQDLRRRYSNVGFEDTTWTQFLLVFVGDVSNAVSNQLDRVRGTLKRLQGDVPVTHADSDLTYVKSDVTLDSQPLAVLDAEISRLTKVVGADRETASRFSALSKRITEESAALETIRNKVTDCDGAWSRLERLAKEREEIYERVFASIILEQNVLANLYTPLISRFSDAKGAVSKLSFTVRRIVDIQLWASEGEQLLDLRRLGPMKGTGKLLEIANELLREPWEQGNPEEISAAMSAFRGRYQAEILKHIDKSDQRSYRAWLKRFGEWLYGTGHIALQYSLDYESVDIRNLSPGTRGIVLLLLYLALDEIDDRPLIIDQPEENLDPKSIFDDLVGLFIQAKQKRQVIVVTHNANLVINADADQVIIANASPHVAGGLPPITYLAGGLEEAEIRSAVCGVLEGGERAFRERARRLRIRLER